MLLFIFKMYDKFKYFEKKFDVGYVGYVIYILGVYVIELVIIIYDFK